MPALPSAPGIARDTRTPAVLCSFQSRRSGRPRGRVAIFPSPLEVGESHMQKMPAESGFSGRASGGNAKPVRLPIPVRSRSASAALSASCRRVLAKRSQSVQTPVPTRKFPYAIPLPLEGEGGGAPAPPGGGCRRLRCLLEMLGSIARRVLRLRFARPPSQPSPSRGEGVTTSVHCRISPAAPARVRAGPGAAVPSGALRGRNARLTGRNARPARRSWQGAAHAACAATNCRRR
jgi:hypothetical protein